MRSICLILFLAAAARADVLHLKAGKKIEGRLVRQIEGKVVDEGSRYAVIDRDRMFVVPKSRVDRLERGTGFMQTYEVRLRSLPADDPDAVFEFGRWLDKNHWSTRARLAYLDTLEIDEDHRGARRALGYRLYEGEWLSPDEINEKRGLVKFEGRWYTPHDLANLQREIERNKELRTQRVTIRGVNKHLNSILRRFATFDKKARGRAYEDLRKYADRLDKSDELRPLAPRVRKIAVDVKAYYDYLHKVLCARMLARTEIRATHTQLKKPIETFQTQLGQAIGFASGQSPVTIQLPELKIAEVKTTVDIPAGCK